MEGKRLEVMMAARSCFPIRKVLFMLIFCFFFWGGGGGGGDQHRASEASKLIPEDDAMSKIRLDWIQSLEPLDEEEIEINLQIDDETERVRERRLKESLQ